MYILVRLITLLCVPDTMQCTVLYYSNSETKLTSTRHIPNFYRNYEHAKSNLKKFKDMESLFPTDNKGDFGQFFVVNSLKRTYKTRTLVLFKSLRSIISNCHQDLEFMNEAAYKQVNLTVGSNYAGSKRPKRSIEMGKTGNNSTIVINAIAPTQLNHTIANVSSNITSTNSNHTIVKRGTDDVLIPVAGKIMHLLTGVMGPEEYSHFTEINKDMVKVIKKQSKIVNRISQEVQDRSHVLDKLIPEIENYTSVTTDIQNEVDFLYELSHVQLEIQDHCQGIRRYIENVVVDEANAIKSINERAMDGHPSPILFPPDVVYPLLNKDDDYKKEAPIFKTKTEIPEIFSLQTAGTLILHDKIVSVLHIPNVDFTFPYTLISDPNLSDNDLQVINTLSKISLKPIDHILCNNEFKTIAIFSSRDIPSCVKWRELLVCHKRHIKHDSLHYSCKDIALPGTIAIELSPVDVAIYSQKNQNMSVVCSKSTTKTININSKFSKIYLPINCELIGEGVHVGKYRTNSEVAIDTGEVKSIPLFINDWTVEPLHDKFSNYSSQVEKLISDYKEIRKTEMEMNNTVIESNVDFNETFQQLEELVYGHNVDSPAFRNSISIGSLGAVILGILIFQIILCCKNNVIFECCCCLARGGLGRRKKDEDKEQGDSNIVRGKNIE